MIKVNYNQLSILIDNLFVLLTSYNKYNIWNQYINLLHSNGWNSIEYDKVTQSLVDLEWLSIHKQTMSRFN